MGTEKALKRAIQRERRKKFPPEPSTALELTLDGEWRKTISGEDWLNGDLKINDERVIIFASTGNLRLLEVCLAIATYICTNLLLSANTMEN